MASAWRNFKNIFSRPLFTIIFRPEMLKFHPYSILTGDTMVGFVIFYSQMSNIESNNSQNGGLEDYNNISDGIFPHFTTPSIKISLG